MKDTTGVALENTPEDLSLPQAAETDDTRAMTWSVLVGGFIGWGLGIGQLLFIGSWEFFYWPFMSMIPLYSALGGALYGMILGGSGIFSKPKASNKSRKIG